MNKEEKEKFATEFDLLKQIMIDLGNINETLALMNIDKIFPSNAVRKSTDRFYKNRYEFYNKLEDIQK